MTRLQDIIRNLRPFGDVLEIGFTNASNEIQKYHPRTHILLSMDPKALLWAKDLPSLQVIPESWQTALARLGVFDTIFFGMNPVESEWVMQMKYTDAVLEDFCRSVSDGEALSLFLRQLEQNDQITQEQKKAMEHKYRLRPAKTVFYCSSKSIAALLEKCLISHMRKGSRFSCYLKTEEQIQEFLNTIDQNPLAKVYCEGYKILVERI